VGTAQLYLIPYVHNNVSSVSQYYWHIKFEFNDISISSLYNVYKKQFYAETVCQSISYHHYSLSIFRDIFFFFFDIAIKTIYFNFKYYSRLI